MMQSVADVCQIARIPINTCQLWMCFLHAKVCQPNVGEQTRKKNRRTWWKKMELHEVSERASLKMLLEATSITIGISHVHRTQRLPSNYRSVTWVMVSYFDMKNLYVSLTWQGHVDKKPSPDSLLCVPWCSWEKKGLFLVTNYQNKSGLGSSKYMYFTHIWDVLNCIWIFSSHCNPGSMKYFLSLLSATPTSISLWLSKLLGYWPSTV